MDYEDIFASNHLDADPESAREDLFMMLAERMQDTSYLQMRDHFDKHVEEDGIEQAYQCLVKLLLRVSDLMTTQTALMYTALTGDRIKSS